MSYRNRRSSEPREIVIRYATQCAETGKPLKKGDRAIYYPSGRNCYHPDSQQAAEYYSMKQADSYGLLDANW